jgi:hypothetical protein
MGTEIYFIGNTDLVVTEPICTTISAVVDNDLMDIW